MAGSGVGHASRMSKKNRAGRWALAMASLMSAGAGQAQTTVLSPVRVEGEQEAALRASVQQERARLARVPGGTNLVEPQREGRLATLRDALDYQPGIVIQDFFGGTDQPRLNIRGSGIQSNPVNRGVLLLQDGLPLNEADGSFVIGLLEPRNAALISARRGANAIAPGATTLGGEIDFQSLTGADERASARVEAGSFGKYAVQAAGGWQGEKVDGRVSASQDWYKGYRHHSRSRRGSVQANLGFVLDNGFENRTYLNWTDLRFQIPNVVPKSWIWSDPRGVMGDGNSPQDRMMNIYQRDPRRHTQQLRLANLSRWGDERLSQTVGVYWQNTDDSFKNPTFYTDTDSDTAGAQWSLDGKAGEQVDYRLAASFANSSMDRQLYAVSPLNGSRLQRFGNYDLTARNLDLSSGASWRFAPDWSLSGDLKWSQVERNARNRDTGNKIDQDWRYLTPRVGMNWTPTQDLRLFANYSRSHEAPTFWEIVNGDVAANNPAAATSKIARLDVQKARTVELGAVGQYGQPRWEGEWSITAYRSEVADELLSMFDASGNNQATLNYGDRTRHQGVEVGVSGVAPLFDTMGLQYRLAWTYSDFRFRGGEYAGNRIAGVPRNLLSAEVLLRSGAWRFGPNVRWLVSDTPTDHANTAAIYQDSYALLGFSVHYQPSSQWRLWLQADNLTDRRYASSYVIRGKIGAQPPAAQQPTFLQGTGRSITAGLSYRY